MNAEVSAPKLSMGPHACSLMMPRVVSVRIRRDLAAVGSASPAGETQGKLYRLLRQITMRSNPLDKRIFPSDQLPSFFFTLTGRRDSMRAFCRALSKNRCGRQPSDVPFPSKRRRPREPSLPFRNRPERRVEESAPTRVTNASKNRFETLLSPRQFALLRKDGFIIPYPIRQTGAGRLPDLRSVFIFTVPSPATSTRSPTCSLHRSIRSENTLRAASPNGRMRVRGRFRFF